MGKELEQTPLNKSGGSPIMTAFLRSHPEAILQVLRDGYLDSIQGLVTSDARDTDTAETHFSDPICSPWVHSWETALAVGQVLAPLLGKRETINELSSLTFRQPIQGNLNIRVSAGENPEQIPGSSVFTTFAQTTQGRQFSVWGAPNGKPFEKRAPVMMHPIPMIALWNRFNASPESEWTIGPLPDGLLSAGELFECGPYLSASFQLMTEPGAMLCQVDHPVVMLAQMTELKLPSVQTLMHPGTKLITRLEDGPRVISRSGFLMRTFITRCVHPENGVDGSCRATFAVGSTEVFEAYKKQRSV